MKVTSRNNQPKLKLRAFGRKWGDQELLKLRYLKNVLNSYADTVFDALCLLAWLSEELLTAGDKSFCLFSA